VFEEDNHSYFCCVKKILIIGCCGAGKSTLSKKLSTKLGLPVIHLDQAYWKPGWIETPKEEWECKIAELVKQLAYIMDGNYSGSLHLRLPSADQVIILDYPTRICFWRVIKRIVKNLGVTRSDMTQGCPERFDLAFLHYVLVFNIVSRKKIYKKIRDTPHNADLLVLKNDKEVNFYLAQL